MSGLAGEKRLDEIVRDAMQHANAAGDATASFGLVLCDRIAFALEAAGDLLDALRDELRHDVGENDHVLENVKAVARTIGGAYTDYLEGWD